MDAVFEENTFTDFGEDLLYPFQRTGLKSIESRDPAELRKQVRQFAPRDPGVYGMLDPLGRLIYVGKSKCLRNRLLSYFLPNNEEDKAGRIVQSTNAIVWETQPSEFAALVREQFLIRQFQPRFNVQGIPRRQQPIFICLGKQPAEQFYTSKQRDPDALVSLGPLTGASRANRAVEVLNRIYKLRDCGSKQACGFTDQLQLFDIGKRPGCIRLEIASCLGPCISVCSRKSYDQQVELGRAFLAGKSDDPIHEIQTQMEHAVTNLHFEQAAVHREDLRAIQWLHRRTTDIATARNKYTFVYPIESHPCCGRGRPIWYLIRKGMIEAAIAAPVGKAEQSQVAEQLRNWVESENLVGTIYTSRPESLALVTSWFRKNRSELKATFNPAKRIPGESESQQRSRNKSGKRPRPRAGSRTASPNSERKIVKV